MSLHCSNLSIEMECDSMSGPRYKLNAEFYSNSHQELQALYERLHKNRFDIVDPCVNDVQLRESVKRIQKAMTGSANAFKTPIIHSQSKTEQMKRYTFTLTFENCEQEPKTTTVSLVAPTMIKANRMFDQLYARDGSCHAVSDIARLDGVEFRVTSVVEEKILVDTVAATKKK
jgi:hypothetical protein